MKKLLLTIAVFASLSSFAQEYEWGIGGRVGNPFGGTVKKYLSDENAIELSFGRYYDWGYSYNSSKYKNQAYGFNHRSFGAQLHYLWQWDIGFMKDVPGTWNWVLGGGGQTRFSTVRYTYYDNDDKVWRDETVSDIDLGVDATFGVEYIFEDIPLSLFIDHTLFLEVADDFYFHYYQPSAGARYNF